MRSVECGVWRAVGESKVWSVECSVCIKGWELGSGNAKCGVESASVECRL